MRMSCNGCRVLRKGCSEDCSIRPCLQWIKSPDAQGNATVFLAKFYGRAGLLNLINAGPEHLRPAIFRSLLYEACGRVVNPIYGSVGLLWSGSWHLCQAAVDSVLKGAPIMQISTEAAAAASSPMAALKAFDIRHVPKGSPEAELHRVGKPGRSRFKRSGGHKRDAPAEKGESSGSHSQEEHEHEHENEVENENESMVLSEGSMVTSHTEEGSGGEEGGEVQLELTLGLGPGPAPLAPKRDVREKRCEPSMDRGGVDLALDLATR